MTTATIESNDLVDHLADRIVGTAGRLAAATCRWLLLVADFDARNGCARFGMATTAHWLAYSCSLSQRTAIERVRVARSLAAHPRLVAEMSAGRASYSHVRAISRVARPGEPALVEELINVAEHGTVRQLESMVRGLRSVRDIEDEAQRPTEEYVTYSWSSTNHRRMSARLDPERGTVVESAVNAVARAEGLSAPDALVRLAEIGLAALADSEHPPRALRSEERAAVVVHVDARQRSGEPSVGRSRERPLGRIADGPALPDHVVQRLLCAGRIRTMLHGNDADSTVLDVGRSHRVVSQRQFRALLERDGGCRHPGCAARRGLQAHHVKHWLNGGRTDMANLVLLCERHHHLHHEGVFRIEALGAGRFRFHLADGTELPEHIDPAALITSTTPIEDEHASVAATSATSRWDGTRLDHHYAVAVLSQSLNGTEKRSRERPAPPSGYDPWAPITLDRRSRPAAS